MQQERMGSEQVDQALAGSQREVSDTPRSWQKGRGFAELRGPPSSDRSSLTNVNSASTGSEGIAVAPPDLPSSPALSAELGAGEV